MTSLPVLSQANLIGTDARPIRASSLPKLLECPGSVILTEEFWKMNLSDDDGSGPAAQTGSLIHAGADAFHKHESEKAGLEALEASAPGFPLADRTRAEKHYRAYVSDPKNKNAKVVQCEQKVRIEIPPSPLDPTGMPVIIRGTLDQIRQDSDGYKTVWDIKTGATYYGVRALNHYVAQQAAYTLAGGEDVFPGGLICTEGYFKKPPKVFFKYTCTKVDMMYIMEQVADIVARARMGRIWRNSGDSCERCVHKSFEKCTDYMKGHAQ